MRRPPPFLRANIKLLNAIAELEHRLRRADLMADAKWQFDFYDERLGAGIVNERRLSRWLGSAAKETVAGLMMTREQVLAGRDIPSQQERFPPFVHAGEHRLLLSYRFEPGHEADGVTASIPVAILNQLSAQAFEWLVPGLFVERMTAILRALPKRYRRSLVPLPDFVKACVESLDYGAGDLISALTVELERMTGMQVPADAWRLDTVPPHLNMRFKVFDSDGAVLATARDLAALQRDLNEASQDSFGEMLRQKTVIEGRRRWDFGPLPAHTQWRSGGVELVGYPGLVDDGDSVSVKVFQEPAARDEAHFAGLTRLMLLKGGRDLRSLIRGLGKEPALAFMYANAPPAHSGYCPLQARDDLGAGRELDEDAAALTARTALLAGGVTIMDADAFTAGYGRAMSAVGALSVEILETLRALAKAHHEFVTAAAKVDGPGRVDALGDARAQVGRLVHRRFLTVTPLPVLKQLPRYVRAATVRLNKLDRDARADTRRLAEIMSTENELWRQLRLAGKHWRRHRALIEVRWMVEELRVSVFAQELGAQGPISVKRVMQALERL
ncbi:MAG: DUF3418 domain-containing protein [Gammaproteobacteria bacterium]|nr:DUF3418 domain-containing protein [Gammaproteobacteria bacterium]